MNKSQVVGVVAATVLVALVIQHALLSLPFGLAGLPPIGAMEFWQLLAFFAVLFVALFYLLTIGLIVPNRWQVVGVVAATVVGVVVIECAAFLIWLVLALLECSINGACL